MFGWWRAKFFRAESKDIRYLSSISIEADNKNVFRDTVSNIF